jgi:hypothetical protein
MSKIKISNDLMEKLGIKDYSVIYKGRIISGPFFHLQTGIEKVKLNEVLVDENDLQDAIKRAAENKEKGLKKGIGDRSKYLNNINDNKDSLDDSIIQNPNLGRLITERVVDRDKEILLVDYPFKKMNDIVVNSIDTEIITLISGIKISTVDGRVPDVDITRFDVNNKGRTLTDKESYNTELGKLKVNNPNFENKLMLINSIRTEEIIKNLMKIIRSEVSQLSFDIQKDNFNNTPEEVLNSERYGNQVGMVFCSDYIRACIEKLIPRKSDFEDRSTLHELFYSKFGNDFINSMKITFTVNLTKTLTSELRYDDYDYIKKIDGQYNHRDFICKESFSIPFNPELLIKFIDRIYDIQAVINISMNAILYQHIGIDIDPNNALKPYLHAGDDIDFEKFNLINSDNNRLEKIKQDIDIRLQKAFKELEGSSFRDLIKNSKYFDSI